MVVSGMPPSGLLVHNPALTVLPNYLLSFHIRSRDIVALAGVAQWIEHEPANQEPKGRWFDSQSGHMPGLQARTLVAGAREATTH